MKYLSPDPKSLILISRSLFIFFLITCVYGPGSKLIAQTYRNASDIQNLEPLAGFTQLRSSKELYLLWAQDNIFKNQIVDYFPTPQPAASLLGGNIKDVFAPSQILANTSSLNETTRTAVVAADMDNDGIDEIVKLNTTSSFDLLLSITKIGSDLEVSGNTVTSQIDAQVHKGIKSQIQLFAGNYDEDVAREIVVIWSEGNGENPEVIEVRIFDFENGAIKLLSQFSQVEPFLIYDAILSDLDLDGIPEIVLAYEKMAGTWGVECVVIGYTNGVLDERISTSFTEFSSGIDFSPDLSLSVTQGDFDADVAPEVAIFLRQAYPDLSGFRVQLKVLQPVDDVTVPEVSLFEEFLTLHDRTLVDTTLDGTISYQPIYATAGDLNGDGDDESVLLMPPRDRLIYNDLDSVGQVSSRFFELPVDYSDPIICFTRGGSQTINLEIGDLNRDGVEELIYTFIEGCTEDILSDNIRGARISTQIFDLSNDGNAALNGYLNSNEANTQFYGVIPAVSVLGDFNGDNFRLGKGRYFRRSEVRQPIIVLNAPPIHFDKLDNQLYDINRCYKDQFCSFASTYFTSTTSSMKTSTSVSAAWSASIEVEASLTADAVTVKSSIEGSVKAKYGERFSKYKSSGTRLEISTQVSAIEDDQIYATVSDYDIWEYPVFEKDSLIAHLISVTPTVLQNRWFPSKSFNAYDYLPDHEVGNVLSYREMKPELSTVSSLITSDAFTLSANSSNRWTINQQSFRESGSSFEQKVGLEASLKVETEAQFKVFGGSAAVTVEGEYEEKSLTTHQTRVSDEIEISVEMGGVDESLGEVKYSVNPYCYWAKNGSLVIDYTTQPEVPAPGASDTWWSANYGHKADPALILPWQYDPEKGLALQDEQVKRFQSKSIGFSNSNPDAGDTIMIYVEVHNWSLIPTANPVEVGFYLCDPTDENNRIIGVNGGMSISTGDILEPRGNRILSFRWKVPDGLPTFPRIYARLDPDNREDEIHEENNFGFNILNISTNRSPCPVPMITATGDFLLQTEVEAFPNPVIDQLNIRFHSPEAGQISGGLYNTMGQNILQFSPRQISSGTQELSWNLSSVPSGIYYCQLLLGKQMISKMILKE